MSIALVRSVLWTIPLCFSWTAILVTLSFAIMPFASIDTLTAIWRFWARSMLWLCGARVNVAGLENLEAGQHYIFASNHLSLIDSPLIVAHIPRTLRFLAKRELFSIPFLGWYLGHQGHIAVDRGDARSTVKSLADAARVIHDQQRSVLVFPEGTRSPDGKLQEFKEGAALLAIRAETPLVPIAVVGTERVLPSKSKEIRPGRVELRIGKPIEVAGWDVKQRGELNRQLVEAVQSLLF